METMYEKAIQYIVDSISEADAQDALKNEDQRMPIESDFVWKVADLLEEFGMDYDLPEGWYLEFADTDEIAYKVVNLKLA